MDAFELALKSEEGVTKTCAPGGHSEHLWHTNAYRTQEGAIREARELARHVSAWPTPFLAAFSDRMRLRRHGGGWAIEVRSYRF